MSQLSYWFLLLIPTVWCQNDQLGTIIDISSIVNYTNIFGALRSEGVPSDVLIRMLDASTKVPSGILDGNYFDFGNFDECYNIQGEIYGKYCLGTLHAGDLLSSVTLSQKNTTPHITPRLVGLGVEYVGYHFAICVPSTTQLPNVPGVLTFDFCYSKDTEPGLSTGAIITITVLAFFLLIICISTVFDTYLYYTKDETPYELLIAFSLLSNGRKIFSSTTNPDQLLCLNGIKAISMMWVLISHEYFLILYAAFSNFAYMEEWENDPVNMYILGATVSVDTFFTVGGLVTVYTFLKSADKGVKFNIVLYYVHRYLRLTPALGVAALVYTNLIQYLGNGPLWKIIDLALVQTCKEAWWSTLLYVTNYVKKGNCAPQTWYLSADMQLFVLSPLVLVPLRTWPKYGLTALVALAVAGCLVPFGVGFGEHIGSLLTDENFSDVYYVQTYTRFGPYVIGMICGYFIYKIKKSRTRLRMNPASVLGLWILSLTGLVACVYAGHDIMLDKDPDRWANSIYLGLNRPAWALSLCGLIFLCVNGYGGPVNAFLSLPIFQFLTKISYSMYLVHFAVIMVRYSSMKQVFKFTSIGTMHAFWGDFMVTLVLSLALCLAFESPVIIIEKYLFGSRKNQKERPSTSPNGKV